MWTWPLYCVDRAAKPPSICIAPETARASQVPGETRPMKLGFFTMPIHPLAKDWRQSLREDREAFMLADELGFAEGYCGEHVTDRAENITSCAMFLSTLVDAVKTMKLGTGTINMPNAHPAAVASQIAMLDHMLDGRFIFGISPGGLLSDAEILALIEPMRAQQAQVDFVNRTRTGPRTARTIT